MAEEKCPEYARLEGDAHAALKRIVTLAEAVRGALNNGDIVEFRRLDRELENAQGHKERVIGALREHAAEHGCQKEFFPEL